MWNNRIHACWIVRGLFMVFAIAILSSITLAAAAQDDGFDKAPSSQEGAPGETRDYFPLPGAKDAAPVGSVEESSPQQTAGWPGGSLPAINFNATTNQVVMCGSTGSLSWQTSESTFQVVRQCTISTVVAGFAIVSGTSSVSGPGDYELEATLGLGAGVPDAQLTRYVNIYTSGVGGADKSLAVSGVVNLLTPGSYTFTFYTRRYSGDAPVNLLDPQLSVVFVPLPSGIHGCFSQNDLDWATTAGTYETVRSCNISSSHAGKVLVLATASVARLNGPYEAEFALSMDDGTYASATRWVNVYDDTGDGTDETVQASVLMTMPAGVHQIQLKARRYSGSGTVLLYDPAFMAILIPDDSPNAQACSYQDNLPWTTTSPIFVSASACVARVLSPGPVLVLADAASGYNTADVKSQFELGYDAVKDQATDRWVDALVDDGDGTDRVIANSTVLALGQGRHTFRLWAKRVSGSGTVHLYRRTLTVLIPGARVFLPCIKK